MTKKILLADDSVTIQKVIELTFMDQDCEIVAVSNGDEAMAQIDGPEGAPFDLVIADVHMPGANGYEVARNSKDLRPELPVLLLVGTFEPFDEDEFEASGSDEFLKKPFDSQELLQRVEALLDAASSAGAPSAAEHPRPAVPDPEVVGAASGFDGLEGMPTAAQPDMAPSFDLPPLDDVPEALEGQTVQRADALDLDDDGDDLAFGGDLGPVELGDREESTGGLGGGEAAWGDLSLTDAAASDGEPVSVSSVASEPGETFALEPETTEPAQTPEPPQPVAATISIASDPEPEGATQADAVPTEPAAHTANGSGPLSDDDVDRIARRVADLLGEGILREVAWEVVPDLAEVVIRDRIRELESQVE